MSDLPRRRLRRASGAAAPLLLLLVVALVVLPGSPLPVGAQEDSSETSGVNRVVDITFPLSGENYYSDTYDACRSGCSRLHRATDLMAEKMVPIHAVVDGEICFITGIDEPPPHYGYMIRLCGDDGLRYSYVHINNDTPGTDDGAGGPEYAYVDGIDEGVRVERGQHIAWVGDSGNAESTGSHLHFEIFDEDFAETDWQGRINPYFSLLAAEERGDYPGEVTPAPDAPAPDSGSSDPVEDPSEESTPEPAQPDDDPDPDPEPEPEPGAEGRDAVPRLAGATRVETALAMSQAAWAGESRAVIIVPAGSHAEALVAAPLAGLVDSPVLLSGPDGLPEEVKAEVRRLDPLSAYVIGSTSQLSSQVEEDLAEAGIRFQARLEADDRYALSALAAEEIASYEDDPVIDRVVLALGDAEDESRAWPDALSASALAAHTATPVVLTEGDRLPDPVADLLTEYRPDEIIVVGGTAAISDDVAEEAAELADAELTRLSGATRYATSAVVGQAARAEGLGNDEVWVATGLNYPDALAAGPAAARSSAPLVLVHGLDAAGSPETRGWLADNAGRVMVIGGTGVITDEVASALLS